MSRVDVRERERLLNTVLLCSMVGLIVALAVATLLVYEESPADRSQKAAAPKERGQRHLEQTPMARLGK